DLVIERWGFVLRQDHDIVDVGVDAIRQGEVDDPVLATEWNSGLCAHARQDRQALTLTASEDDRHRPLHRSMLARAGQRLVTGRYGFSHGSWPARRHEGRVGPAGTPGRPRG